MTALTSQELATREAEINKLVEQDKREEAGRILFDLIVECAKSADIDNANRLRDMLYDVDPMALTIVIEANEIIDAAMSDAISDDFSKAWTGLREVLTEEEFMALYHAMEKHQLEQGKTLVKQGSKLDALFFVTKGNLKVICSCLDKNREVKNLEPGTMIGENCFQPSIWTVSVVSMTPVELSVLRKKQLLELSEKFPGLETKLSSYYERFNDIPQLLSDQEVKRRRYERYRTAQKMLFQVIGKDGTVDERSFKGELDNISQGGLAFLMRIVKRENRWQLFGRHLLVSVKQEDARLQFKGSVVAITVQDLQNHDYAVHLAFDQAVGEEVVRPFIPPEPIEEDLPDDEPEGESGIEQEAAEQSPEE